MLILLQNLFFLVVALMLGYLLIEGWLSQAVWVKGGTKGIFADVRNMDSWATKKHRNTEPNDYWGYMGFYAASFLFILFVLVF